VPVPASLAPLSAEGALLALSGLHLAWGFGATTPFPRVEDLSDARQSGLVALTGILGARAALGFAGRTDVLVPVSTSDRFRRNDRRVFAPLCLALAAGAASARRS